MKRLLFILVATLTLYSCSSRNHTTYRKPTSTVKNTNLKKFESKNTGSISGNRNSVVKGANQYMGVPYKYGGNTRTGFDCSGLVVKVFDENNYKMPRRSADQGNAGSSVRVEDVRPGDLLFFATSGGSTISHVGIVNNIENSGEIKFIHASTSKGVIISSLNESYWNKAFLFARSVL